MVAIVVVKDVFPGQIGVSLDFSTQTIHEVMGNN